MSARDDYPLRPNWTRDKLGAVIDMHYAMCDEIDMLRHAETDEMDRLRRRESQLEAQVETLEIVISRLRSNLDEANSQWADAIAQRDTARHLGKLEFEQSGKWQEMAEDLWEELQEWHLPDCLSQRILAAATWTPADCTCHRILAAKWDGITHAADWADDDVEDDAQWSNAAESTEAKP